MTTRRKHVDKSAIHPAPLPEKRCWRCGKKLAESAAAGSFFKCYRCGAKTSVDD